jgi:hypothetical protein
VLSVSFMWKTRSEIDKWYLGPVSAGNRAALNGSKGLAGGGEEDLPSRSPLSLILPLLIRPVRVAKALLSFQWPSFFELLHLKEKLSKARVFL